MNKIFSNSVVTGRRKIILKAVAVALVLAPGIAKALEGMSPSELRRTVIGAFLARNAGAGVFSVHNAYVKRVNDETLERLLELVHDGRSGSPDSIVNEAVAEQEGYNCPNYEQLPLRMEGCERANFAIYQWKNVLEVSRAAEEVGFSCGAPVKRILNCSYKAKVSLRPIEFFSLGPSRVYKLTANLSFDASKGPSFTVTETQIPP